MEYLLMHIPARHTKNLLVASQLHAPTYGESHSDRDKCPTMRPRLGLHHETKTWSHGWGLLRLRYGSTKDMCTLF